jgi:hypothetical protein
MKLEFTVDGPEPINVTLERDAFTGKFTCTANGETQVLRSPLDPSTHFSLKLKKLYSVEIGRGEASHLISIEHTRPRLLAGFRPHEYYVTVDGRLITTYKGY